MRRRILGVLLLFLLTACQSSSQHFSHGRFDRVWLDLPQSDIHQVVFWLMPGYSRTGTDRNMARLLADEGALVISVSVPALLARMAPDEDDCLLPSGDLENLSHEVQARVGLERYLPPVVAGRDAGAALTYAVLNQAPLDSFAGGLSVGFAPELPLPKPLCTGRALNIRFDAEQELGTLQATSGPMGPWAVTESEEMTASTHDFLTQIPAALPVPVNLNLQSTGKAARAQALTLTYHQLIAHLPERPPVALAKPGDLPLVEVPAQGASDPPVWALFLSGDGGWAGLDINISDALAARGVPVVGLDSLRYFWQPRTPEQMAADLQRIMSKYGPRWPQARVILIGYSQGADVLPFAFNRLPLAFQRRVEQIVLLGPGQRAAFTFHVSQWLGGEGDHPILPEARLLPATRTVCIYGEDDAEDSLCPLLQGVLPVEALPGGHHFDGDMTGIAQRILSLSTPR
ncbi:MAG: AcvB/VirJ family lysyl-phosphatidylglycerol hydrolase [Pseudomonadota bacterium]